MPDARELGAGGRRQARPTDQRIDFFLASSVRIATSKRI